MIVRAIILALTASALFCMWIDQPAPELPKQYPVVQVDYCLIGYKARGQDPRGRIVIGWARSWGPCSLLDRYENI